MGRGPRITEQPCDWCGEMFKPRRRKDHDGKPVRFCSQPCHWASYGVEGRTEKSCSRCKIVQPIDNFTLDPTTSDGHKANCKTCAIPGQRDYDLRRNYGITHAEYDVMYGQQGGLCAICGEPAAPLHGKHAPIDHNHTTGQVREILCGSCNTGIGYFMEDPEVLESAARYLRKWSAT